jgi:hypothetical protein
VTRGPGKLPPFRVCEAFALPTDDVSCIDMEGF